MSLALGQTMRDARGVSYVVLRELGAGGQGVVFEVQATGGRLFIAKRYHDAFATRDTQVRLDALIRFDLSARSPALCGPLVRLDPRHGLGALQTKVEGRSLEDIFQGTPLGLLDALAVAAAICRALGAAARLGIGHGDLAASNLIVRSNGRFCEVTLIDFDNASIPGVPAPTFRGQDFYAAPELLSGRTVASIESDRFALAVLLYELLLLRHPFSAQFGANVEFDVFVRALQQARWMEDPADGRADAATTHGGLPVAVISRPLHKLFREALQPVPSTRPSAEAWAGVLEEALGQVFACDGCGGLFVNEPTRSACPSASCRRPAPPLGLDVGGRVLPLAGLSTVVGRAQLGGDPTISREHAAFQRRGFAVAIRNLSGNGLAVWRDDGWVEMQRGDETVAAVGDRVRFAPGVEGMLREQ